MNVYPNSTVLLQNFGAFQGKGAQRHELKAIFLIVLYLIGTLSLAGSSNAVLPNSEGLLAVEQTVEPRPFITTWQVAEEDKSIVIPTNDYYGSFDYTVDWGDGTEAIHQEGDAVHVYDAAGIYTVKISGTFAHFYMGGTDAANRAKLLTVEQWGDIEWKGMNRSFYKCPNVRITATDAPNLTEVTTLASIFSEATSFNDPINHWDVSNIENFYYAFKGAVSFNQPLDNWKVSNAHSLQNMFEDASAFNQPLDTWDVSNVINLRGLFNNAVSFNQHLGAWKINPGAHVTSMLTNTNMSCENYSATLIGWDSNSPILSERAVFMDGLEYGANAAAARQSLSAKGWTISGDSPSGAVCLILGNEFITTWQTSEEQESITIPTTGSGYNYTVDWGDGTVSKDVAGDATHAYEAPGVYTVIILGDFPRIYFNNEGDKDKILTVEQWGDISWVSMERAFYGCRKLRIPASDEPDLSNVTDMTSMFADTELFNDPIGHWDVSHITSMLGMFAAARDFNQDLSGWSTGNVTSMTSMFRHTGAFNQDLSNWDISKVKYMFGMFAGSKAFNQDLSAWDVSGVEDMRHMFRQAEVFDQSLGSWQLKEGAMLLNFFLDMGSMSCTSYSATLSGWAANPLTPSNLYLNASLIYNSDAIEARNKLVGAVEDEGLGWTILGDELALNGDCHLVSCPASSDLLSVHDDVTLTCDEPAMVLSATTNVSDVSFAWEFEGMIVSDQDTTLASAPGRYYVVATQAGTGCSARDSVEVMDAIFLPDLIVPNGGTLTCNQPQVPLTANSSTIGASISWEFAGSITSDQTIIADKEGIYTAIATVGECQTTQSVTIADNSTLPDLITSVNGEPGNMGILGCSTPSVTLSATTATSDADVSWFVLFSGNTFPIPGSEIPNINAEATFLAIAANAQTGCQTSDTVRVIQDITIPSCAINVPSTSLIAGSSVSISTVFSDRYTYTWGITRPASGWNIVSGDLKNEIQLLVGDPGSRIDLFVDITDEINKCANTCEVELVAQTSSSAWAVTNILATENRALELSRTLDIYPNPATQSTITIDYVSPIAEQTTIKVTNITGRLIRTLMEGPTKTDQKYQFTFNQKGGLASGTYRVEIVTPSKTISRLIIIQ